MSTTEFRQLCQECIALASYLKKNNPDNAEARELLAQTAEKIKSAPTLTQETHE